MAGIKFHGAIDAVISGNHIYRCGSVAGIWLDWMGQGAQVTGNLLHDNSQDMFLEMQHGPMLVANNIFLSKNRSFLLNGEGIAFVHNLVLGNIRIILGDKRTTPFQAAHSTEPGGMHPASKGDSGDYRFYNNLLISPCDLQVMDKTTLPCFAAGNVFTKGTQPSKFDAEPLLRPDFDPAVKLEQKADGWYLTLTEDKTWRDEARCNPVTTELLGKAKVSICAYENADGSPLAITTDYFGTKRDGKNPFPGPFEKPGDGKWELKVWPVGLAGAQP
jgi:alpha-N-arabinofuranosidase